MANFVPMNDSAEKLSMDFTKLGQITNEDAWAILRPAGQMLKEAFREKILGTFQQRSGVLAESIEAVDRTGDVPHVLVYPQGPHHKYRNRKKRGGGMKTADASEVGFVLEFGSAARGIAASHWMENAITEHDAEITEKMQEGFDALCDEKGIGTDG